MAKSFENRVSESLPIEELLLIINPPDKPVHRGIVDTPLQAEVHRYILPTGKQEFVEHPKYFETDKFTVEIKTAKGETVPYELRLPFKIKAGVTGIDRMVAKRNKHAESDRKMLQEYLFKLSKDASIDEDFNKFILGVGGEFKLKEVIVNEQQGAPNPIIPLPEGIHQYIEVDNESLYKLFLKVAWTHAAKQISYTSLLGRTAKWTLDYLTSAHIIDDLLIRLYPNLFTRGYNIEGTSYVFWKYGIDQSLKIIENVTDISDKEDLVTFHEFRRKQFDFASQMVHFNSNRIINDELRERKEELRIHRLALKNKTFMGQTITVCSIQLFGGFFDVEVKLFEEHLLTEQIEDIEIRF